MLRHLGGNPAFKIYDVDPDTFQVMDMRVYISMSCHPLATILLTPRGPSKYHRTKLPVLCPAVGALL